MAICTILEKGPCDILILSHIVEHFVDLKESLKLIDELTHKDTLVYIEVPGVLDLKDKEEYMYDYQDYNIIAHIHNFSLTTLTNVFASKGFKLIKGSEYIRMVMKKNSTESQEVSLTPYKEVIDALQVAKEKNLKLRKTLNNPVRKYFNALAKAVLGRGDL